MKRKFTIIAFVFTFYILHSTFYISTAMAVDSTPSADIKAKLDELKKEIASKAALLKQEVGRKLLNKVYIGEIKSQSSSNLTLSTSSGPKMVSINEDTVFESKLKSKSKFSAKNIALEDHVAALGDSDETEVLTAKKIVLLPAPLKKEKSALWGKVISISDELITLRNADLKNIAVTLPIKSDVNINDLVILTGNKGKNDIFESDYAYIIPKKGILKPTPTAKPTSR